MRTKEGDRDLLDLTLRDSIPIVVEEMAGDGTKALRLFEDVLRELLAHISRSYDLSALDGLTVVNDMAKASADLDIGVELPPGDRAPPTNDDIAVCGASANHVMRNGKLKSHILVLRDIVVGLWTGFSEGRGLESEASQFALHALVHECAHVEATRKFDDAFPIILRPVEGWDWLDRIRWRAILACWDEYAACSASAMVGKNPLDGYVEVFLKALRKSASVRMSLMKRCDSDKDWEKMWDATSRLYESLMKYACYVLGTMDRMESEGGAGRSPGASGGYGRELVRSVLRTPRRALPGVDERLRQVGEQGAVRSRRRPSRGGRQEARRRDQAARRW